MFSTKSKTSEKINEMLEAGAHFGFNKARRHPSVLPYILGRKNGVEIFDLEKVEENLKTATDAVTKLGSEGRQILFVGGKVESQQIIKEAAEKIEMPYVAGRWIGGTLTNFEEIKKRTARLTDLISQKEKGEFSKYTKKEQLMLDREITKLTDRFGGIVNMSKKPAAVFVIDADKESIARDEAKHVDAKVVALCSSDCNLTKVDYPITANDSSVKSITYFVNQIADAYAEGAKNKVAVKEEKDSKDKKSSK